MNAAIQEAADKVRYHEDWMRYLRTYKTPHWHWERAVLRLSLLKCKLRQLQADAAASRV